MDKSSAKKRGAPVLPDAEKRTARYPLRIWEEDHERYERFCREQGIKLAEFYRFASREYIAKDKHEPVKEDPGYDKTYILHMTQIEKGNCQNFADRHNITLAEFFRAAAEAYIAKHSR